MISITQIQYVLALNQTRHFAEAAKLCFVTQPTLSMQLQKLEEELNVILFDRSKNPIIPTPIGEKLILQMKEIISSVDKLKWLIESENRVPSGELKVGVIPTVAPYLLPLFLKKFESLYPKIELKFYELQTHVLLEKLNDDVIDVGLLATPLNDNRFIERNLYFEKILLYLDSKNILKNEIEISEEQINKQQIFLLTEGNCLRNQTLKICHKSSTNTKFESGNIETLVNMVNHLGGTTFIPELAQFHSRYHKNQIKEIKYHPVREISLITRRSFYKDNLIEILEKVIIDSLPEQIQTKKSNKLKILKID
ncbi:MAG: LysR substrate-binding domain-containing protein [Bacteriovoracaceae bacterium]